MRRLGSAAGCMYRPAATVARVAFLFSRWSCGDMRDAMRQGCLAWCDAMCDAHLDLRTGAILHVKP